MGLSDGVSDGATKASHSSGLGKLDEACSERPLPRL